MVGREPELARLTLTIEAALARHPSFVLLIGEPGIGKTTLVGAALATARDRGLRALRGVAIESGAGMPFLPVLSPIEACLADDPDHPKAALLRRELLGGSPSLSSSGSAAEDGRDDARAARLIDAMFSVLSARPTLLTVDDVQWADPATIALLDYASHRAVDVPLAMIVAARDDEPDRLESLVIADGRRFTHLAVGPLSRDAVALQLQALGAIAAVDELEAVYARSAGNPLFVEQIQAGTLEPGDQAGLVPGSLRILVARRFGRLSGTARGVVDALAVLDRPAADHLVGAVAGLSATAIADGLDEAVRARVVAIADRAYRLRHPVFGEVLRDQLDGADRNRLHRRAAEALMAAGRDPAEVAGHWWRTDDRSMAWTSAMAAAEALSRRFAFAGVLLHLERALAIWPDGEPGRAATALRAARAAWNVGDPAVSLEHARSAEVALPDLGVTPIEVFLAQGAYAWDAGDRPAAVRAFDRVHELLTPDTPALLRSRALWGRGRAEVGHGRHAEAHRLGLEAAEVAHAAGHLVEEAEGLQLAGMSLAWGGTSEITLLERGLTVALASGGPETIGHGHHFLTEQSWIGGHLDRAVEVARRGVELCELLGLARSHGSDLRGYAASQLLELGSPLEAAAIIAEADPRGIAELARARVAMRAGDLDAARAALDRMRTAGSIGGPGVRGGPAELAEVEFAVLAGDLEAARSWLERVEPGPGVWGIDAEWWARLWTARLDAELRLAPGRMSRAAPPEAPRAGTVGAVEPHPDKALGKAIEAELAAIKLTGSALGSAEHAEAALPEPVLRWRAAVQAWTAARRPYEAARARLGEARALLVAGRRAEAREALEAAQAEADRLSSPPLRSAAANIARRSRLGVQSARRPRPDPAEPTARELEVLALLAEGLTNPQIAARLFLSPKTVGIHVTRLLDKLGAHTRGEAVAVARRRHLLD